MDPKLPKSAVPEGQVAVSKGAWSCALQKIDVDFTERTPPAYLGDQHNATLYL